MSQKETILNILSDNNWHCTNQFYASYIADPRTRLCEIAKSGVELEWRWCETHPHKKSKEWRLKPQKLSPGILLPSMPIVDRRVEELSGQSKLFVN